MNIGKGKYGDNRSCAHARMIMRECPYCGSELPDDKNAIYCVNCDHIIDEDFLLRQKIKKELEEKRPARMKERPKKDRKQPPAPGRRRGRYDYVPGTRYEEKKSYANVILIAIVVLILLYLLYK